MGGRHLRDQRTDERRMKPVRTAWVPPFRPILLTSRVAGPEWSGARFARAASDAAPLDYTFLEPMHGDERHYHVALHLSPRWIMQTLAAPQKAPPSAPSVVAPSDPTREPLAPPAAEATPTEVHMDRLMRLREVLRVLQSSNARFVSQEAGDSQVVFRPVTMAWMTPVSREAGAAKQGTLARSSEQAPTHRTDLFARTHPVRQSAFDSHDRFDSIWHAYWQSKFVQQSVTALERAAHVVSGFEVPVPPGPQSVVSDTQGRQVELQRAFGSIATFSPICRETRSGDIRLGFSAHFYEGAGQPGRSRFTFRSNAPFTAPGHTKIASFTTNSSGAGGAANANAVEEPIGDSEAMPAVTHWEKLVVSRNAAMRAGNFFIPIATTAWTGEGSQGTSDRETASSFAFTTALRHERTQLVEPAEMIVRLQTPGVPNAMSSTTSIEATKVGSAVSPAAPPAGLPADLLQRLTDQVVRSLDARALAQRERFGRF